MASIRGDNIKSEDVGPRWKIMKKLRVFLPCVVLALLCWHSGHHVYCSEEISAGPGLPAQDDSHYTMQETGADKEVILKAKLNPNPQPQLVYVYV